MEAKLVVVGGDAAIRQYELDLPTIIGRSRGTDLTLGHPLVSRQHCEVFEADGLLMVRDLGSRNGTFVGESRIAEQAMPVKSGDLITVGPVTFRAVYRASDARAAPLGWDADGRTVDAPLPDAPEHGQCGNVIKDTTMRQQRPRGADSDAARSPPA